MREIASGLKFPEGPVAMDDGSVVLVEIARGTLTRITPGGRAEVVAHLGGGPNGAAKGPGDTIYVTNNGGFRWHERDGRLWPGEIAEDYSGGRIERVHLASGKVDVLYTECNGRPLNGPNDLVFDGHGGFYFTDLGKTRGRQVDRGAVYYAKADGSAIAEIIYPLQPCNGIGLSPDGKTLYVVETPTARLWAYRIGAPGEIVPNGTPFKGECLAGLGGFQMFDSLAVDARGFVCVATLMNGGITAISPDGRTINHTPTDDPLTTNICFGGEGLKTAFLTLSGTGRLVAIDWLPGGLKLHHA